MSSSGQISVALTNPDGTTASVITVTYKPSDADELIWTGDVEAFDQNAPGLAGEPVVSYFKRIALPTLTFAAYLQTLLFQGV